jgi:small-conductance mechanosensitive channel
LDSISTEILTFLPLIGTILLVTIILRILSWFLLARFPEMGNDLRLPRQLVLFAAGLIGTIAIVLTLPVSESSRNQVLALIGVLLSGSIAFSSTTIVANAMAGIMQRITRPFKIGDFIRSGEHFGRVTERGLLDTEIQTESRELVSLPNTLLISNPVTVIRSSGTIISASLSLGYDVHHARVQSLLIRAANDTGLQDPFVHILELGDFSITYRVGGLLTDVKTMLTTRSNLMRHILDTLHSDGVEIVSPTFMNQRPLEKNQVFISMPDRKKIIESETHNAEEIMFDKAEEAEQVEKALESLRAEIKELESQLKEASGEEKPAISTLITEKRAQIEALENKGDQKAPTV